MSPSVVRRWYQTLVAGERTYILQVLRETHEVIGGPRGDAARLGVKRATLISRMETLGIPRWPP